MTVGPVRRIVVAITHRSELRHRAERRSRVSSTSHPRPRNGHTDVEDERDHRVAEENADQTVADRVEVPARLEPWMTQTKNAKAICTPA